MKLSCLYLVLPILVSLVSIPTFAQEAEKTTLDAELSQGENPWPEIRKKRINTLLP